MAWNYQREESNNFEVVPEGKHRIRVKSAEMAVSKTGNNMIALQFEVSGYTGLIYHYIVFMADRPEITNRMLTQFYDSFKDIPEGDNHIASWIGKVGAASIKHEEYNGRKSAKISWFIKADKQSELSPWKEPEAVKAEQDASFVNVSPGVDEEVPF